MVRKTVDEAIDGIVRPAVISVRDPVAGEVDAAPDPVLVAEASVEVVDLAEGDARVAVPAPEGRPPVFNGIGMAGVVVRVGKNLRAIRCHKSKWCFSRSPRVLRRWRARSN